MTTNDPRLPQPDGPRAAQSSGARGAFLVGAGIAFSRLFGFARERAIAHYLGNPDTLRLNFSTNTRFRHPARGSFAEIRGLLNREDRA